MKTNITFKRKCRLARMAVQLDPSTVSGVKHIIRLARRSGLSLDRLVSYLNAYETAGESGIIKGTGLFN